MIHARNDGMHDFGYACSLRREIIVDGLFVDDANHPETYQGLYLFADPDAQAGDETCALPGERPFPYSLCEKITVQGLSTASGKRPLVSPNVEIRNRTNVIMGPM